MVNVKKTLRKIDFRAKKRMGQNFLHDEDDRVLEIGAGLGIMTDRLSLQAGEVVALEIDPELYAYLKNRFGHQQNLHLLNEDILKYEGRELPEKGVKVIANLPYYISTPILLHLLKNIRRFSLILVMLQKEVAERITADPGSKKYGSLSIAVQYHTEAQIVIHVPRTAFHPVPDVDSAVVELKVREKPRVAVTDPEAFFRLVRAAFAQRRKTLRNSLIGSRIFPVERLDLAFERTGIVPSRRAETLSMEEFAQLARALS
jgi:16S rRNA (adenine1518-N6/adenine1519-N6)-dimethyltransferase